MPAPYWHVNNRSEFVRDDGQTHGTRTADGPDAGYCHCAACGVCSTRSANYGFNTVLFSSSSFHAHFRRFIKRLFHNAIRARSASVGCQPASAYCAHLGNAPALMTKAATLRGRFAPAAGNWAYMWRSRSRVQLRTSHTQCAHCTGRHRSALLLSAVYASLQLAPPSADYRIQPFLRMVARLARAPLVTTLTFFFTDGLRRCLEYSLELCNAATTEYLLMTKTRFCYTVNVKIVLS